MAASHGVRQGLGRAEIEAAGVRVVENVQLDAAYWLPVSRLVVAPPGYPPGDWEKVASIVLSATVPTPRSGA